MAARDITASRHRGNSASAQAFAESHDNHVRDRDVIYGLIERTADGLTSKEIGRILMKPINTFSGRLTELKQENRIKVATGRREGRQVHVKSGPPVQLMLL